MSLRIRMEGLRMLTSHTIYILYHMQRLKMIRMTCVEHGQRDLKDLNPGNGDIIDGATLLRPWHGGVSGLP